jgi:hypothetical protein
MYLILLCQVLGAFLSLSQYNIISFCNHNASSAASATELSQNTLEHRISKRIYAMIIKNDMLFSVAAAKLCIACAPPMRCMCAVTASKSRMSDGVCLQNVCNSAHIVSIDFDVECEPRFGYLYRSTKAHASGLKKERGVSQSSLP